jgi:hypothetical protein
VTSFDQLALLARLGFNRLSFVVQDFAHDVQVAVNRVQSESETRALFEEGRRLGFHSINLDLIYGLPFQTRASFARTVDTVVSMRPDRVAVYSYAHVPWIRGNQKRIDPKDLPPAEQKVELFAEAMERPGRRLSANRHGSLRAPGRQLARVGSGTLHRLHGLRPGRPPTWWRAASRYRGRQRRLRAKREEAVDLLRGARCGPLPDRARLPARRGRPRPPG